MTGLKKFFMLVVSVFLVSQVGFAQFTVTPGASAPNAWTSDSPEKYIAIGKEAGNVDLTIAGGGLSWTATIQPKYNATISGSTLYNGSGNETVNVVFDENTSTDLNIIEVILNNGGADQTYFIIQDGTAPYITNIWLVDDATGTVLSGDKTTNVDYYYKKGDVIRFRVEFSEDDVEFYNIDKTYLHITGDAGYTTDSETGCNVLKGDLSNGNEPMNTGLGKYLDYTYTVEDGFQAKTLELVITAINNGGTFFAQKGFGGTSDLSFDFAQTTQGLLEDRYNVWVDGVPPTVSITGSTMAKNGNSTDNVLNAYIDATTGETSSTYVIVPDGTDMSDATGLTKKDFVDGTTGLSANESNAVIEVSGTSSTISTIDFFVGNGTLSADMITNAGSYDVYAFDSYGNVSSNYLDIEVYDGINPTIIANSVNTTPGVKVTQNGSEWTFGTTGISVAVEFSEQYIDAANVMFTLTDVTTAVSTANATTYTNSGVLYTFNIVPPADGEYSVDLLTGDYDDMSANRGTNAATQLADVWYDSTTPDPTILNTDVVTNLRSYPVTVSFNEEIVDVTAATINPTNCTIDPATPVVIDNTNGVYSFNIIPDVPVGQDVVMEVSVDGTGVTDLVGNVSSASAYYSILYNGTTPVATFSLAQGLNAYGRTNAATPLTLIVDFGDQYVSVNDLASTLPLNVTPAGTTLGYRNSDPIIDPGAPDGDLKSQIFTFDLTPNTADGEVAINLPANTVREGYPNSDTYVAQGGYTFVYDVTAPIPTVTSVASAAPGIIPITVQFDEDVKEWVGLASDITVTPASTGTPLAVTPVGNIETGTTTDLIIKGWTYAVNYTAAIDDVLEVDIQFPITQDLADNDNVALPTKFSITYDGSRPDPTITLVDATGTALNWSDLTGIAEAPYVATVDFGEKVKNTIPGNEATTLDLTKVTTTGVDALNGGQKVSDGVYSFSITPTVTDPTTGVIVEIVDGQYYDIAGNSNTTNTQSYFSLVYDGVRPVPSITAFNVSDGTQLAAADAFTNQDVDLFVDFGEPVMFHSLTAAVSSVRQEGTSSPAYTDWTSASADNSVWSFNISGLGLGDKVDFSVTVDGTDNLASDAAANYVTASDNFAFTFDGVQPDPTIYTSLAIPNGKTNETTIPVIIDWDSKMTASAPNFVRADDVTITSTAAAGETLTVTPTGGLWYANNSMFSFNITMGADDEGEIAIDMDADVASNVFGNYNIAAVGLTVYYDGVEPIPTLKPNLATGWVNTPDVTVWVEWGEVLNDFDSDKLDVTNGTINSYVHDVTAGVYSYNIALQDGAMTSIQVDVDAGEDTAGNWNAVASNTLTIQYDGTAPIPTISLSGTNSGVPGYVTSGPITVDVDFGEGVSAFASSDIIVTSTVPFTSTIITEVVAPNLQQTYQVEVTPVGAPDVEGLFTFEIAANVAWDRASNANSASNIATIIYDGLHPSPTVIDPRPATPDGYYTFLDADYTTTAPLTSLVTNKYTIPITVAVGEEVTGFIVDDVMALPFVTKSGFAPVDAANGIYSFNLNISGTMPISGQVIQSYIFANKFTDLAGNQNVVSQETGTTKVFDIEFDATRPTPVISAVNPDVDTYRLVKDATTEFEIDFSEVVNAGGEFTVDDVSVTLTNNVGSVALAEGVHTLTAGPSDIYTFELNLSTAVGNNIATIHIDVPANVTSDLVSNWNYAATTYIFDFDNTQPTPTIISDDQVDLVLNSSDLALNATNSTSLDFVVDYGRYMQNNMDATELYFNGASYGGMSKTGVNLGLGTGIFSFNADMTAGIAEGNVLMTVPVSAATDWAVTGGNTSLLSAVYSFVYDVTAPTMTPDVPMYVNNVSTMSLPYTEAISGISVLSITIDGTNVYTENVGANSPWTGLTETKVKTILDNVVPAYTASETATFDMDIQAVDFAGNLSPVYSYTDIVYDITAPKPTIIGAARTGEEFVTITVDFGEAVTGGFSTADLDITSLTPQAGSPAMTFDSMTMTSSDDATGVYVIDMHSDALTPTVTRGVWDVVLDITNNVTSDLALNSSVATTDNTGVGTPNDGRAITTFPFVFDTTNPWPTVTLAAMDYSSTMGVMSVTNANVLHVTVDFGKSDITFNDIQVINDWVTTVGATVSAVDDGGATDGKYYFTVTNTTDAEIVTIDVAAGICTDSAGNESYAHGGPTNPAPFTILIDKTAPVPVITIPPATVGGAMAHSSEYPLPVEVSFGELVKILEVSDITVTNATGYSIQNFAPSANANTYTFEIIDADGATDIDYRNMVISVNTNSASDVAGNANVVTANRMVWWDTTDPVPTIKTVHDNGIELSSLSTDDQFPVRNGNPISIYFDFLEKVEIDRVSLIEVVEDDQNSGASNTYVPVLNPGGNSARNYNFDFIPTYSEGNVTINVYTDAATDEVNIGSKNATMNGTHIYTFEYDLVRPEATVYSVETSAPNFNGYIYTYNIVTAHQGTINSGIDMNLDFSELVLAPDDNFEMYYDFNIDEVSVTWDLHQYAYTEDGTQEPVDVVKGEFTNIVDASQFQFGLVPTYFDGEIYVELPAGVVQDDAVNWNNASNIFTIDYDGVYPRPSITFVDADMQAKYEDGQPLNYDDLNKGNSYIKVDFHEQVVGYVQTDDMIIKNITMTEKASHPLHDVANGVYIYSFDVKDIRAEIIIPDMACTDLVGNESSEGFLKFDYEGTNPVPFFSANENVAGKSVNRHPDGEQVYKYYSNATGIPIQVTFNEQVEGFMSSHIAITGATMAADATNWIYDDDLAYPANPDGIIDPADPTSKEYHADFNFVAPAEGPYTFEIAEAQFTDVNMNDNAASYPRPFVVIYDVTSSTPSISAQTEEIVAYQDYRTNGTEIVVDINFGEVVEGFVNPTLTNASVVNNSVITDAEDSEEFGTNYRLVITPNDVLDHVNIIVDIPANSVSDLAGNPVNQSTITIEYDGVPPTPVLASSHSFLNVAMNDVVPPNTQIVGFTQTTSIPMTATFNDITGYSPEDVFELLASEIEVRVDGTAATGSITGFTPAGPAGVYNFDVDLTAMVGKEGLVTVEVPGNVVTDMAGNVNVTNDTYAFYFDDVNPELVSITNTSMEEKAWNKAWMVDVLANPHVNKTVYDANNTFRFEFSELVSGFTSADISVTMGGTNLSTVPTITVTNVDGDATWASIFDVVVSELPDNTVPAGELVVVSLKDASVDDLADNNNATATDVVYDFVYDNVAPDVANVYTTADDPGYWRNGEEWTNKNVTMITTKFSEPVNHFNIHEIDLTKEEANSYYVISGLDPNKGEAAQYSFNLVAVNQPTDAQTGERITITYPANVYPDVVAYDRAGNPSTAGVFTINYDVVPPKAVTFVNNGMDIYGDNQATEPTDGKGYVNDVPMSIVATYNENVWYVGDNDLALVNADTQSAVSPVDGATIYTYNFNATDNGLVEVTHNTGNVTDLAENASVLSPAYFSVIYDNIAPVPTITVESADMFYKYSGDDYENVAGNTFIVTVDFNDSDSFKGGYDDVRSFTSAMVDVTTTNGAVTITKGAASKVASGIYSFTVTLGGTTALAGDAITVAMTAGKTTDFAGNDNEAAESEEFIFDTEEPTPSVTIAEAANGTCVNGTELTIDVAFDEIVRDFNKDMLTISSGTLTQNTNTNTEAMNYQFTVTGMNQEEEFTVEIAANETSDLAGNGSNIDDTAPRPYAVFYDNVRPVPTITTNVGHYTNLVEDHINVTVTFPEAVSVFDGTGAIAPTEAADIVIDPTSQFNKTAQSTTNVEAGSRTTNNVYTFELGVNQNATDGLLTIDIPQNVASDCATNGNIAAQYTIYYDKTAPEATIDEVVVTGTDDMVTKDNPIVFNVEFSEPVQNPVNPTATTVTGASVTISDVMYVTESIVTADGGVTEDAITKATYSVTFTGTQQAIDGDLVTLSYELGSFTDLAGNNNEVVVTDAIKYDGMMATPSVAVVAVTDGNVNATELPIVFTLSFGEALKADPTVTSTVGGTLAKVSDGEYTYSVTPTTDGDVTVYVAAGDAKDIAENTCSMSNKVTVTYDATPPVAVISTTWPNPANKDAVGATIPFDIEYSEEVVNLTADDVVVTGGTKGTMTTSDNMDFVLNVVPVGKSGTVTLQIVEGGNDVVDLAGNATTTSNLYEFVFDGDAPKPMITMTPEATTVDQPTITVTFVNEEEGTAEEIKTTAPFNFTQSEVNVVLANGTIMNSKISDFTMNAATGVATFKVDFTGVGESDFTVSVPDQVCQDVAANYSVANSATFRYDVVKPTLVLKAITAEGQVNENGQPVAATGDLFEVEVAISETATASSSVDTDKAATISNSTAGTDITMYAFNVRTSVSDDFLTITIPANTVVDAAGNGNTETSYKIFVDGTAPTPTVEIWTQDGTQLAEGDLTNKPLKVRVDFGEHVRDFDIVNDATDVNLMTAEAGALITAEEANGIYEFKVYDVVNGKFTVSIPAGIAQDDVNRDNVASNVMFVNYDNTAPAPSISAELRPNDGEIDVIVAFNEDVDNFTAAGVKVTNKDGVVIGTVSNFVEDQYSVGRKYEMTITGLSDFDGVVNIKVPANVCQDKAGNDNVAADEAYEFDSTGPEITIIEPTAAAPINSEAGIEFVTDGTMVGNATLKIVGEGVELSGTILDNNTATKDVITAKLANTVADFTTLNGVYTFTVEAVDELGNKTQESVVVTIDNVEPVVDITSPASADIISDDAVVTFTVDPVMDVDYTAVVEIAANGKTYTTTVDIPANMASQDVAFADLNGYSELEYGDEVVITVKQTDEAGNVGMETVTVQYGDDVLPEVFAPEQEVTNAPLQVATAQSNVLGTIYLVLEGNVPLTLADLETAIGEINNDGYKIASKADVTAPSTDMFVSTENLQPGTYYAYAVDVNGRLSENRSNPVIVTEGVKPVGDFEWVTAYGALYIQSSTPNGGFISWDFDDGTTIGVEANEPNPTHIFDETGTYTVVMTVVDENGLNPYTVSYDIVIEEVSSAFDMFANIDINVYPNPSDGRFTLTYENIVEVNQADITIMDIRGRMVKADQVTVNGNEFSRSYDLSMYSKGVYLIKVHVDGQVHVKRLVIEK